MMQNRIVQVDKAAETRQRVRLEGMEGYVVAQLKHRKGTARETRPVARVDAMNRAVLERGRRSCRREDFDLGPMENKSFGEAIRVVGDTAALRRPGSEQGDVHRYGTTSWSTTCCQLSVRAKPAPARPRAAS